MEDILAYVILQVVLNFIGASIRWVFGSLWRTLTNKPKRTYKSYVYGEDFESDSYDDFTVGIINPITAVIFIAIVIGCIVKFNI